MADEIDFDEMERYEAELRDEIRALTEQNKLLENELVAVSAERDMWKEKYATTRENFIAHVFKAVEGDGK